MLLAIEEVVNVTSDSTVVICGAMRNMFDLPQLLTQQPNPQTAFLSPQFLGGPSLLGTRISLLAPATQSSDAPPSFATALQMFPNSLRSMAYWPSDLPNLPAYKQSLVSTPMMNFGGSFDEIPDSTWLFVIAPDGSMVATAVQIVTYDSVGAGGQGLPLGTDHSLTGCPCPFNTPEDPDQVMPPVNHALRLTSWQLKPGVFIPEGLGYLLAMVFIDPRQRAPSNWGAGVTQTILLANQSPVRNVFFVDEGGNDSLQGIFPSPPIFYVSLLVGDSINIKRPRVQDFQENLVEVLPAAQDTTAAAWLNMAMLLTFVLKTYISDELPWPINNVSDYFFDELTNQVDPGWQPPLPAWLQ